MNVDFSIALDQIRDIVADLLEILPNLLIAALVFALFFLFARWVRSAVRGLSERRHGDQTLARVLGRLAQWAIILFGLLAAVTILFPSFQPGDLITLLGVSGVAIGFAFKDIFQNFLAGILILLTRPFRVGDQIVVGSFEGTVEDIQTRATYLRTYKGQRVVIPNSSLYTDKVVVKTAFPYQRTDHDVEVGPDDAEATRSLLLEVLRSTPGVLPEPAPDVLVADLAKAKVKLRARWWTRSEWASVLEVQDRVLQATKVRLAEHDIDLA